MLRQPLGKDRALIAMIILFAVIGLGIYSQVILRGVFLYDDFEYVVDNPIISDLRTAITLNDPRQVGYLSFALNYTVGGEDPFGYHLVNVLVHIANSLLVFAVAHALFFALGRFREPAPMHRHAAFLAALLFLVHPVQTQAVSYITQRFTSLATLFYLLAVWLYLNARARFELHGPSRAAFVPYALSLLCAVLAMRTKEIAFTIPIVLALLETFVLTGSRFQRRRFLFLIPLAATCLIIPLSLLGPEWGMAGRGVGIAEVTRSEKLYDLTRRPLLPYLFTQFRVIIMYIRTLLMPTNLHVVYDFPLSSSFLELKVMASFLALALFACSGFFLWRTGSAAAESSDESPIYRMAALGVGWFFITLSVESSVIPIKDVIFEHRVYLPSVGFFLAAAVLMLHASGRLFPSRGLLIRSVGAVLLTAVPLAVGASVRNDVWTDEVKLWDDVVRKAPEKAIGYNNRGMAYAKRGDFKLALQDLDRAISYFPKSMSERMKWENADINPGNMAKTYVGRGDVYIALGDNERAKEDYQRSKKLASAPGDVDTQLVLADQYAKRGAYKHAVEEYNKILAWDPEHIEALNDRANAYSYLGRYREAINDLTRIIALEPDFMLAYYNRGIARAWTGKKDQAIEDFELACRMGFQPACDSIEIARRGGK